MEHTNNLNKSIVITSIYPPTEAVRAFAKMPGFNLTVVGDKKTPEDWNHDNVKYLPVNEHDHIGEHLNKVLPFNHYSRKMIGYLYAIANGAEMIIDTDDDNIPKPHWSFPPFDGAFDFIDGDKGFVNIYQLYSDEHIWPRGLPLQLIMKKFDLANGVTNKQVKVGMWQGLADEDPDVDAIYRLTSNKMVYFNNRAPVVLGKGTISPFNTQNTIVRKELFALMYLPTFVTFRFTDILRGLIAQPIMWMYDYHLGFVDATVVQKRNPHDYMNDFISEIPMYQYSEKVIELSMMAISSGASINDNLYNVYEALLLHGIVQDKELKVLSAWLKDISILSGPAIQAG